MAKYIISSVQYDGSEKYLSKKRGKVVTKRSKELLKFDTHQQAQQHLLDNYDADEQMFYGVIELRPTIGMKVKEIATGRIAKITGVYENADEVWMVSGNDIGWFKLSSFYDLFVEVRS